MFNRHVEQLYRIIPEGTLVRIVGRPSDPVTRLLKPGHTGQDVVTLQLALREKGYDVGLADARYGEQTASAVRQLQEDYGLHPDGLGWPMFTCCWGEVGCRAGCCAGPWPCWRWPRWFRRVAVVSMALSPCAAGPGS